MKPSGRFANTICVSRRIAWSHGSWSGAGTSNSARLSELEAAYRQEQDRRLSPLSEEETTMLRTLVADLPALWEAAETTMEDRKRLVRCLIREVVLLRDEHPPAHGGVTTIRIGWCSGAWSELRVHRPSSSEQACTPEAVLKRIRGLAQHHPDAQVAARLNAEGARTRTGLPWTAARVGQVRQRYRIPSACPVVPKGTNPRGDGLVCVRAVATQLGVARSVISDWCRYGFLAAEQKAARDPRWIRLTAEEVARLDGTLAAAGYGRWRLREAQRVLGLSAAALYQRLQAGELKAYRARIADHWEWRVGLAAAEQLEPLSRPRGVHAASQEV